MMTYIIRQHLQFILMDAPSAVDTDAHQHNARLVHRQADGVRRAVARVPAPTLARFGETVGRRFDGVQRVQPIDLMTQRHDERCGQTYQTRHVSRAESANISKR